MASPSSKATKHLLFAVRNWEEIVAAIAILLLTFTAVANVVTRYVFQHPFTWAEELQCICLCWAAFPAAAAGYKRNLHFGLDFVVDHMGRAQALVRRLITFIGIFLFGYLCFLAIQCMLTTSKHTVFFRLHYAYLFLSPALGFFSMTLWSVIYFVESFVRPESYNKRYLHENAAVRKEDEA